MHKQIESNKEPNREMLVNFPCTNGLVPGLPAVMYNPIMLFLICGAMNGVVQLNDLCY